MNLTDVNELKLKYQQLSDADRFIEYAQTYAKKRSINQFGTANSYWNKPSDSDKSMSDIFQYHFPAFFEYREELQKLFETHEFTEAELYSFVCAVTAYKYQPHVMFLWERRKEHGLQDYTLNTHELLLGTEQSSVSSEQSLGSTFESTANSENDFSNQIQCCDNIAVPDNLRYTIY